MPETKKKNGRPTTYTAQIDKEICTRIARNEALINICKESHLPTATAVMGWLSKGDLGDKKYVEFVQRYARARQASGESVDADIMDIQRRMLLPRMIDNPAHDVGRAADDKGYSVPATIPNPEFVDAQVGREVISAHKWRAAHLHAQRYGNRVEVAHSGTVKHDHAHRIDPPDWMKDQIEQEGETPPMIDVTPAKDETTH